MSFEKTISDSLRKLGDEIGSEIERRGFSDTGASQEFEIRFEGTKVQLLGANYIRYLVYGRPPGKFPPVKKIKEYVSRNNIMIEIDGRALTENQVAYVIGRSIARNGTLIYRGQKEGLELNRIVDNFADRLVEDIANEALENIKTELKI